MVQILLTFLAVFNLFFSSSPEIGINSSISKEQHIETKNPASILLEGTSIAYCDDSPQIPDIDCGEEVEEKNEFWPPDMVPHPHPPSEPSDDEPKLC